MRKPKSINRVGLISLTIIMFKSLLTFIFAMAMVSSTFADIDEGLVVYLELNGDSTATVGPKVYSPDTLYPAMDNWGNATGAMEFAAGENGFLYMMASEVTDLPLTNANRTLACWVLMPSSSTDKHLISYGMNGGNATAGKHCHLKINGDSTLGLNFWNYDFKSPTSTQAAENSDYTFTNLKDSAWHHIAGVYADGEVFLYIDGEPVAVADTTGNAINEDGTMDIEGINTTLQAANAYLAFGSQNVFWPQPSFKGALDEVRIYNRALDEDEITDLYEFVPEVTSAPSVKYNSAAGFYPNPATDMVMFAKTSNVRLYNIAGQLVLEALSANSVDVSALSNGLYLIEVNNQVSKLIIK